MPMKMMKKIIVSEDNLIKVDFNDLCVGCGTKKELHCNPMLHRAFSVFIYHNNKMLIQKRNAKKYHSGGLWTNACCSHFKNGQCEVDCVTERLSEELNINAIPKYLAKFIYYHKFADDLFEYEYDHIYVLDYNGKFSVNPDEIEDIKWVDFDELMLDVMENPDKYTVWFVTALSIVLQNLT